MLKIRASSLPGIFSNNYSYHIKALLSLYKLNNPDFCMDNLPASLQNKENMFTASGASFEKDFLHHYNIDQSKNAQIFKTRQLNCLDHEVILQGTCDLFFESTDDIPVKLLQDFVFPKEIVKGVPFLIEIKKSHSFDRYNSSLAFYKTQLMAYSYLFDADVLLITSFEEHMKMEYFSKSVCEDIQYILQKCIHDYQFIVENIIDNPSSINVKSSIYEMVHLKNKIKIDEVKLKSMEAAIKYAYKENISNVREVLEYNFDLENTSHNSFHKYLDKVKIKMSESKPSVKVLKKGKTLLDEHNTDGKLYSTTKPTITCNIEYS